MNSMVDLSIVMQTFTRGQSLKNYLQFLWCPVLHAVPENLGTLDPENG
jgi:hypothetical protein